MNIPLIGIPADATLEECDGCHDLFPLRDLEWTGRQFLCNKCVKSNEPKNEPLES